MKGIYLTEEGKQEIENKIAELKKEIISDLNNNLPHYVDVNNVEIYVLRNILESATILPVEKDWNQVKNFLDNNPVSEILADGVVIKHLIKKK